MLVAKSGQGLYINLRNQVRPWESRSLRKLAVGNSEGSVAGRDS